ncbi:MAG TPA: hypothetical protein VLQ45_02295, partial [Thermoanaerobaculia bacterium]|nr:hypothetical protein [Thermoanaerobaculia bacterium]
MAKIRDLPLDRLVRGWLLEEKLRTSEDLWRAVGPRYQEGLDGVHEKTRITRDHLVHALGAAAAAEPKRRLTLGEGVAGAALLGLLALAGLRVAEALHAYP